MKTYKEFINESSADRYAKYLTNKTKTNKLLMTTSSNPDYKPSELESQKEYKKRNSKIPPEFVEIKTEILEFDKQIGILIDNRKITEAKTLLTEFIDEHFNKFNKIKDLLQTILRAKRLIRMFELMTSDEISKSKVKWNIYN